MISSRTSLAAHVSKLSYLSKLNVPGSVVHLNKSNPHIARTKLLLTLSPDVQKFRSKTLHYYNFI